MAGFSWCPGCGLGRSIIFLLHGELLASLNLHYFGLPALAILVLRIYTLTKKYFLSYSK
ncbi:DUF2752 domain-containing protein [Pedobacter sp. SYSU D00535]|uniref:DUF2752 domain-containing protein n=1 Tax=Pedobacter sp. SYSU D00535 TaxID=2810308 RepID=UPI001F61EC33|nr:DUF2752 domain-containing protein [Pedobacter sp. SYSU D00535]